MTLITLTINFWRGLCQLPLFWQSWVHFIFLINIGGSILFWNQQLSAWVLGGILASFLLALLFIHLFGFTKLMGLTHLPLLPVLYQSYLLLPDVAISNPFGMWIRLIFLVNGIALFLDAIDLIRYITGNRKSLLD